MANGLNASQVQIIKTLEIISQGHAQLNDFFSGAVTEVNANRRKYPLLWADTLPSRIMGEFGNVIRMKFRLGVFDLMQDDFSNEITVQSDAQMILMDIMSKLEFTYDLAVNYEETGTITQARQEFGDNLTGAYMDLVIDIPYDWVFGLCEYPNRVSDIDTKSYLIDADTQQLIDSDLAPLETN